MRYWLALLLALHVTQPAFAQAPLRCTVLADASSGKLLKQEGQCAERVTSGSTFKIAISLMGYDSGILRGEHAPTLPFKEGYVDWNPAWRAPIDPAAWMKLSVVWYSQYVTTQLGAPKFKQYVDGFGFGNRDVSGDTGKNNGLTQSWIGSSLKISPLEQVDFLRRVVKHQLPVSKHAYDMTARLTKIETLPNGWELHGKTGTGFPKLADGSSDYDRGYGWFVGWATKGARTIVFARLVQDEKEQDTPAGLRVRAAFMREAPALLESL